MPALPKLKRHACENRALSFVLLSSGRRSRGYFVFRAAAQRRFVAAMMARRPAALSLRFFLTGAVDAPLEFFRAAAHRCRCAAAILARAAADILRRAFLGGGAAPSVALPVSCCRSSAILSLMRFFCSSKPSMAAVRMSVVSLVGI
jgi:hypothetical protein